MQSQPVITAASIVSLIEAALIASLSLGWIQLDDQQLLAISNVLVAAVAIISPLIGAWWAYRHVTPLANPRDRDGSRLIREINP